MVALLLSVCHAAVVDARNSCCVDLRATTVHSMDERYVLALVPLTNTHQSIDDIVANRQGAGWQLVSRRADKYGAEVIVFSRPG